MATHPLSTAARRFLVEDVGSVMQLELVLLLHRERDRAWSATAAAGVLRASEPWIEDQLRRLVGHDLAHATQDARGPAYRFAADTPLAPVVDEIARCYAQWRTSIISLIFRGTAGEPRH